MVPATSSILMEMNIRAVNGLIGNEFGEGFYAFDPLNNLAPFQPVEFELSAIDNDITVSHTDGSGNYQYSLDGGATWGDASTLIGGLTYLLAPQVGLPGIPSTPSPEDLTANVSVNGGLG